jgi:hypothetical protein
VRPELGVATRPSYREVMRRRPFAVALVTWTFFVWTTRIANIWRDAELDTGEQVGRTLLAASFTVLALAVVATLWRGSARARLVAVGTLAAWSTVVWVVRDVGIVTADHDAGFVVVHVVLGVVSIVVSALAWRESRRADGAGSDRSGVARRPLEQAETPERSGSVG